ncbi:MAG: uracil-DNA glycosylase [Crocinitomicaceae bacterium]|nr:uracil-DNA glycosylase [Crocinitomicaceae bacterium]
MDNYIESSWKEKLQPEFEKVYFKSLIDFLSKERNVGGSCIFPEEKLIFRAFDACPFEKVKVVVLGQDPYPTKGHAHGLCFSVNNEVSPLPKSLKNIFKELSSDLEKPERTLGDLNDWAEQGVLLLNTVLTVREGEADSHAKKGWELFTDAVMSLLSEKEGVVYILWGGKAQKKAIHINRSQNFVIESSHPSPLSSYRGFFGSKPFSKTNDYITKQGKCQIVWC